MTYSLLDPAPARSISVTLSLAAIETLDRQATAAHVSRQELLRQFIHASLLTPDAHLPRTEDPLGALLEQKIHFIRRSHEIAEGKFPDLPDPDPLRLVQPMP